jgi:hypothetical protein
MKMLVYNEKERVWDVPSLHGYAHPVDNGYHFQTYLGDGSITVEGGRADDLDHVLAKMVERGIPHSRLVKLPNYEGYQYEPLGMRIVDDYRGPGGATFKTEFEGHTLKLGLLKNFRALLYGLHLAGGSK